MSDSPFYGWQPPTAEEVAALFPRYQMVELAAAGGLSSVYRIRQEHLGRDLALKLLRRGGPETREWEIRFRKEALIMSRLKHSTIPTVYDFGHIGADWFCIMEYIEGVSMHVGHYTKDWRLEQVQQFLAQAAEGLHMLHEDGVVHGDIKPDNIMVSNENEVKIIDFGTACTPGERKLITDYRGPRQLTAGFAAPELYEPRALIDRKADVFGLGACLLQFLLGEAPPENFDQIYAAIADQPKVYRRFLDRAMSQNPANRQVNCLEFAADLRKLPLRGKVRVNTEESPAAKTTRQLMGFLKDKWTALVGS
jgi:serine/threonine protein kinase